MSFVWSDAWLMYSIVAASREGAATLVDVIEVGDMVNHAIFTTDEIDGGLERLERVGLVTVSGQFIVPSPEALELYSRARHHRLIALDVIERLSELLDVAWVRSDANEVDATVREHRERFQEQLRGLRPEDV
jgi:hypothetical protein